MKIWIQYHTLFSFLFSPNEIVMKMSLEVVRKLHLGDIHSNFTLFCVSKVYQTFFFFFFNCNCLLASDQTVLRYKALRCFSPWIRSPIIALSFDLAKN